LLITENAAVAGRTEDLMQHKPIRRITIFFAILFCFTAICMGCSKQKELLQIQESFNLYLNNLFLQEVQADSLSLNYSLAEPANYGIIETNTTLGEYGIDQMKENLVTAENRLSRLNSFDYNLLSEEQQLIYDIVQEYLKADLSLGKYDYYYECLGPTTGIQAQLPILLAEYSFYDKDDIDTYLKLLPCVYDYFLSICEYEREKSEHGLFMRDEVAIQIIKQCEAFISDPENNFLITHFNEKIDMDPTLTEQAAAAYKAENSQAVISYVVPAYQLLIDTLSSLLGTGTNHYGLYYYSEGRNYYECLAKSKIGTNKSMIEITNMLNQAIRDGVADITTLIMTDSKLMDKYLSFSSFPITNPKKILSDLKQDIQDDFPRVEEVNCEVKYVPDSLSDYLSPAMYLIPPIDNYQDNEIYINGRDKETLSTIYTTVAHEGYPGHLYQNVYFRSKHPAPIRNVLSFVGYDEGWATYAELYSYRFAGIDHNLAEFLRLNNIVILCMYARADIGIHYEGWTRKNTVRYVNNFIENTAVAEAIYDTLLEEPAIYLPYAVGYLEIMELKQKAEQALGNAFRAKDFHQFLLDIGPAQFDVIDHYLDAWIAKRMK
jgi:uncharacterized protein (DUF885 family)